MGGKSKIDWCDYVFNPITGCKHGCEYCYAAQMVKRFNGDVRMNIGDHRCEHVGDGCYAINGIFDSLAYPFGFAPTLHRHRLFSGAKMAKVPTPSNFFVGAMADIFGSWVPDEWIKQIFITCKQYPHHRYMFLTKNPKRYAELADHEGLPLERNFWFGSTVTASGAEWYWDGKRNTFLSVEPMLESMNFLWKDWENQDRRPSWVIVGALTANSKPVTDKLPRKTWVLDLLNECRRYGIPVFMKESIKDLMGNDFVQEMPKGLDVDEPSEKIRKQKWAKCRHCGAEKKKKDLNTIVIREKTRGSEKPACWLCDICLEKVNEDEAIRKSAESALTRRSKALCMKCGADMKKTDMTAVLRHKGKNTSRSMVGYICERCKSEIN